MNFSKDYIELCKNDKVQELREFLSEGDYCVDIDSEHWFEELITHVEWKRIEGRIWLPTGDQLDQCIVDICKKHKWFYKVTFYASMTTCEIFPPEQEYEIAIHSQDSFNNPLICKLKLLLSLLESEE